LFTTKATVVSGFGFVPADIVGFAYYKWESMFLDFPEQFLALKMTSCKLCAGGKLSFFAGFFTWLTFKA
jgi:hypothetical protein